MQRSSSGTNTSTESAERERVRAMTVPFDDLIRASMARDPEFTAVLRQEVVDAIRSGEVELGRFMLRDWFDEDLPAELSILAAAE